MNRILIVSAFELAPMAPVLQARVAAIPGKAPGDSTGG